MNVIVRLALALTVIGVAVAMTAAAGDVVARCTDASEVAAMTSTQSDAATLTCPGPEAAARADAAGAPRDAAAPPVVVSSQTSTALVLVATGLVFSSIFAILFSYRPRPGGVRTSHR